MEWGEMRIPYRLLLGEGRISQRNGVMNPVKLIF